MLLRIPTLILIVIFIFVVIVIILLLIGGGVIKSKEASQKDDLHIEKDNQVSSRK
jgi:hypothetical protein